MDNENGGAPVISFAGTRKGSDLVTDAALLLGLERFTPRFKREERFVKKVKGRFADKQLTLVGHSLGGSLASANAKHADKVVTLDKGVGLSGLFGRGGRNETSIRGDDFSTASWALPVLNFSAQHTIKLFVESANIPNSIHNVNDDSSSLAFKIANGPDHFVFVEPGFYDVYSLRDALNGVLQTIFIDVPAMASIIFRNDNTQPICNLQRNNISEISLSLTNESGKRLDFNKQHWTVCLQLNIVRYV
ncbi:hypothetical protein B484DRAFT_405859 [Ochromonadaceae sp. CCMP2298]|nr:hypothetical protein B484DRAFT_405859 [Ochromonadaceae sp. CCMP2298]